MSAIGALFVCYILAVIIQFFLTMDTQFFFDHGHTIFFDHGHTMFLNIENKLMYYITGHYFHTNKVIRKYIMFDPNNQIAKNLLEQEIRGDFPEQRTEKWYAARKDMLTASEISSCLGCNIYMSGYELLLKKLEKHTNPNSKETHANPNSKETHANPNSKETHANPNSKETHANPNSKETHVNPNSKETHATPNFKAIHPHDAVVSELPKETAVDWGVKFEMVATQFYEYLKKEKVYSVGLVTHTKYKWLGASPDGLMMSGRLLEIKCPFRRIISDEIPIYYWIQVQIQLEVCNLDECDYLECEFHQYKSESEYQNDKNVDPHSKGIHIHDGATIYWKMLTCSLKKIKRDTLWFKDNIDNIEQFHNKVVHYKIHGKKTLRRDMRLLRETKEPALKKRKRNETNLTDSTNIQCRELIDWKYWVSATSIRNYMIDDPLLDWLSHYYGNLMQPNKMPDMTDVKLKTAIQDRYPELDFQQSLMKKGVEFEKNIMEILKSKFDGDIATITNYQQAKSNAKYLETVAHIKKGTPIIYQGVLHDHSRKIFGMPDLLVRRDYIDKMFGNNTDTIDSVNEINPSNYQYRVVEIKYSSLILCANGKYIRNSDKNMQAYKGQLYMYTKMLGDIQGCTPAKAYVIGKSWSYTKKKNIYSGTSFDRTAIVNFNVEKDIRTKSARAIKWVRQMRFKGHRWTITPPSRDELKPNMCNIDNQWHDVKQYISTQTNDITQLWMCGINNRKIAENKGITNWKTHPKLTSKDLGICGDKTANILQIIIDYNQNIPEEIDLTEIDFGKNKNSPLVHPDKIKSDLYQWRKPSVELFVDFETVSDVVMTPDFQGSLIFMIGVGWYIDGVWGFKCFIAERLTSSHEKKILLAFHDFIDHMKEKLAHYQPSNCPNMRLWHWGHAERTLYRSSISRHADVMPMQHTWCDMLRIFKDEPIVSRGMLNFSLKTVVKSFYDNGFIESSYTDSPINNGLNAMMYCIAADIECLKNKSNLLQSHIIEQIKNYNEIDCKVIGEILRYLRKTH
jgi:putative phage-type endonuclease